MNLTWNDPNKIRLLPMSTLPAIIKHMIDLLKEEYHELHSPYTVLLESFIVDPELLTNECSICVPSGKLRL